MFADGSVIPGDLCMAVDADSNDSPSNEEDWPNNQLAQSPKLAIFLSGKTNFYTLFY